MRNTTTKVAVTLATALGFCGTSSGQGGQDQYRPPLVSELDGGDDVRGRLTLVSGGEALKGATVSYEIYGKEVSVHWDYSVVGLSGQDFYSIQTESVSFWPTCVRGMGPGRIAVAGVTKRGKTTVEVWTFAGGPGHIIPLVPTGGGPAVIADFGAPVAEKNVVYFDDHPDRQYVSNVFPNHGNPDELFLRFYNTKEIYILDVVTEQLTKAYTTTGSGDSSVPAIPNLEKDYHFADSQRYPNLGYVYYWQNLPNTANGNVQDVVVLRDSDEDGVIDIATSLSVAQWISQGYGDFNGVTFP